MARDPIRAPGPPKDLEIIDIDKNALTAAWSKPDREGGVPVSGMLSVVYFYIKLLVLYKKYRFTTAG